MWRSCGTQNDIPRCREYNLSGYSKRLIKSKYHLYEKSQNLIYSTTTEQNVHQKVKLCVIGCNFDGCLPVMNGAATQSHRQNLIMYQQETFRRQLYLLLIAFLMTLTNYL